MSYDLKVVKSCMKEDPNVFKDVLKNKIGMGEELYHVIRRTVCEILSFDYLNLFYDNGYCLSEFLDSGYVCDLFKTIISNFISNGRLLYDRGNFKKIEDSDIELFYNEKIPNRTFVLYVGNYLLFKLMMEKEKGDMVDYARIYGRINSFLFAKALKGEMMKKILYMSLDKMPLDKNSDALIYFVKYCLFYGDDELKETAKSLAEKSKFDKKIYDNSMSQIQHEVKHQIVSFDLEFTEPFNAPPTINYNADELQAALQELTIRRRSRR